jgi:quercetin dioxygenase-like cupin family protein
MKDQVKGQRLASWDEPGEWTCGPSNNLRFFGQPMGLDDKGAATLVLVVKYEPGCEVAPHYHDSDYCSIVVDGSIEITRRHHGVGSVRFVKAGTVYGPLRAGPEGCAVDDGAGGGNTPKQHFGRAQSGGARDAPPK